MPRYLLRLLPLLLVGLPLAGLALLYHLPLDTLDPSPRQPIPFSHQLHAGSYEIDCRYCHRHVEQSQVAGIPDLALCLSCHQQIATDRPGVKQLLDFWEHREPVPWVRLHQLPDHVYFPHMLHVRAGLDCSRCHGQVTEMAQLTRAVSLKMGWCLACHRENRASIDCWACHI